MLESESLVFPEADTHSPVRAIHSLLEHHVRVLAIALSGLPGIWSLERHECYDGNLILMLTLQPQDMQNLVVSRDESGFRLNSSQNDEYRELGCFSTMSELIATLRASVTTTMKRDRTA